MGLESSIRNAIDFTNPRPYGRPLIKLGLDQSLDASKHFFNYLFVLFINLKFTEKCKRQDIAKHVTVAAKLAANQLPNFLKECSVVYLPEMGHLIAIREWTPDCHPEDLEEFGFQFMVNHVRFKTIIINFICLVLVQFAGKSSLQEPFVCR